MRPIHIFIVSLFIIFLVEILNFIYRAVLEKFGGDVDQNNYTTTLSQSLLIDYVIIEFADRV